MRLQKKMPASDEETNLDPLALPRFSFESDNEDRRPLVSTERLFQQFLAAETGYDPGYQLVRDGVQDDHHEIVV